MSDPPRPLSDATARRLLARAVELDAQLGSGLTLPEHRRAALEAGIDAHAFDAAVAEHAPMAVTPADRPLRAIALDALRRNALAAGGFVVFLVASTQPSRWLGEVPMLHRLGMLLAILGGIRLAHRLRGTLVRDGLIAIGAAQAVVFVLLLAGARLAELNMLNWGTFLTGVLATLCMRLSQRASGAPPVLPRVWARVRVIAQRWLRGSEPSEREMARAPRAVRIVVPGRV